MLLVFNIILNIDLNKNVLAVTCIKQIFTFDEVNTSKYFSSKTRIHRAWEVNTCFAWKNSLRIHLIKSKYLFYYFFLIKLWIFFNFGNQQIWNITIANACIVWYEVEKFKYYSRLTMGLIFIYMYMHWLPHFIHIDNRSTYELHTTLAFIIPKVIKWWSAHNININ